MKKPINISKQNFQENFEISISESGAEIVVFDNLINLIPGFRYSARYEWPSIRDWMGKLEREYGVSILIVHHDNDKGDGAGTKDIRTQCGTILFLQDPRSKFVKGNWSKGTNSPFSDYIAKKGVLFKATIEKCSQYPNAVHSEFGAYFAYDAANPLSSSPGNSLMYVAIRLRPRRSHLHQRGKISKHCTRIALSGNILCLAFV